MKLIKNRYFFDLLLSITLILFLFSVSDVSTFLIPEIFNTFLSKEFIPIFLALLISIYYVFVKYFFISYFFHNAKKEILLNVFVYLFSFFSAVYMLRIFTLSRKYILLILFIFFVFNFIFKILSINSLIFYYSSIIFFVCLSSYFVFIDFEKVEDFTLDTKPTENIAEDLTINYKNFNNKLIGEFTLNQEFRIKKFSICCDKFSYENYGSKSIGSIQPYKNDLYYFSGNMIFLKYSIENIINGTSNLDFEIIPSNIKEVTNNGYLFTAGWESIKDTLIYDEKLYLSYVEEFSEGCVNVDILRADFPSDTLEFEKFLNFEECIPRTAENFNAHQSGGALEITDAGQILMSVGDFRQYENPQDVNSIFGKILIIDPINSTYNIVSKGHRNPQGLVISKNNSNLLIETEHGPKGGDEINVIAINEHQNFGWPISSYGNHYDGIEKELAPLYKNHKDYGFQEPIYTFPYEIVKSHGISDIENNYYSSGNTYFVGTLNGRVLYNLKLTDDNTEVTHINTYDIGERVRNIKYDKLTNMYFLLMEDSPSIAVLEMINKK